MPSVPAAASLPPYPGTTTPRNQNSTVSLPPPELCAHIYANSEALRRRGAHGWPPAPLSDGKGNAPGVRAPVRYGRVVSYPAVVRLLLIIGRVDTASTG